MTVALIEIRDLKKVYNAGEPNEFYALNGISLSVDQGDFLAIMGVSGSGKSTLMNILGCLDHPTSGTYMLDGEDVGKKSSGELAKIRRNKIGFVFQNFNLLPRMQAVKNVELPLIYEGIPPKERRQRAKHMLEVVGLGNRVQHKPSMLSGGEQQRVAIARALVNEPMVILADEPTGNLDSKSGHQVMKILLDLHLQGRTIIVVTHDPTIGEYAGRVIKIIDGTIKD
ncbi:MAG: ABC transporter ATP-binding protein [Patescibacteria group bacterium]|nr:ABC transporter ATP-binding protein [Patescibacteria group bacterium]MDD5715997.1 ABC transporter ATP-binding protein [Patescibacteria group bacterium]